MKILLKFLGSLEFDLKQHLLPFQIAKETSVREIITELIQNPDFKELKSFFSESFEVKRSLLILINQQEISVLDGMTTLVKQDDVITFIPVIHGGKTY
ncbi:MAG: MoaD/ThiS family protein [Candidatus Hodarchaeales archaeon]|jgi:molybdopterin converting factor small subunit